MKLSLFIILLVCLGCSKNTYQIDKSVKLEPQFSMDATQFANEDLIIRSCTEFRKVTFTDEGSAVETIKTEKDSIKR